MRLLVTGGVGYIGSALLPVLADRGHTLRVLDDFSGSSPRNLIGAPPIELVRGDIRDPDTVREAMTDIDAVIHLAAVTGAEQSHEQADRVRSVNTGGTATVVDAAATAGVDRLVFASSCNVYGDAQRDHLPESATPRPRNPYAESKLAGERACRKAPIETVALRLATNFGWSPGVRFNLVVNDFVVRALGGEPLPVYGDGTNWRPFMHVTDTARTLADALAWAPGVYNAGHGNYRIKSIAETVEAVFGRPVEVAYLDDRDPGPSYHADFSAARAQGLDTQVDLAAGIEDLAERFSALDARPRRPEP